MRNSAHDLERIWLAVGWLGVFAVTYLSLVADPLDIGIERADKVQHLAAYGALMLWFAQLAVARARRMRIAIALTGLGVALELAQLATADRVFSVADMAANAAGVAIGWWLAPPRLPNFLAIAERRLGRRNGG